MLLAMAANETESFTRPGVVQGMPPAAPRPRPRPHVPVRSPQEPSAERDPPHVCMGHSLRMDQRPHEDVFDPALAFSRLIFATIKSKFDRTTRAFFGKRRSEPCSLEERVKQLALESQLGVRECRVFPANGRHVAILGCGDMGRSVAVELLRRGCTVRLHDSNRYTLRNAKASIIASMRFAVQNELLLPADVKPLSERLKTARSLSEAVDGASFVWEAITEDAEAKQLLFLELGRVCDDLKVSPAQKPYALRTGPVLVPRSVSRTFLPHLAHLFALS